MLLDCADAPALPGLEADLVGVSGAMEEVRRAVARAADAPYPVLVQGESGAGKELVARAIHRASARRTRPFCALNCAALPDELIEAELFGHARGAFTGAVAERRGLFEDADGGALFLDEIGELAPRGQAKLLRVIQENEIRRVGETIARRVDVRLVAATNRTLEQEVEAGRFRRDLWYRLDVIRIAGAAAARAAGRRAAAGLGVLAPGDRARRQPCRAERRGAGRAGALRLARQRARAAERAGGARRRIAEARHVGSSSLPATLARVAAPTAGVTLEQARRVFETRFVRAALARAGGHRGRAAAELGVTRQGLAKLMDRLGVDTPEGCALTHGRASHGRGPQRVRSVDSASRAIGSGRGRGVRARLCRAAGQPPPWRTALRPLACPGALIRVPTARRHRRVIVLRGLGVMALCPQVPAIAAAQVTVAHQARNV